MATATVKEHKRRSGDSPKKSIKPGSYSDWIASGPLRVWREDESRKLSQHRAAMFCGVVLGTIQSWERGAWVPKEEKFEELARILKDPNLKQKWMDWLKRGRELEQSSSFTP